MAAGRRRRIEEDHDCRFRDELEQLRGVVADLRQAVETEIASVRAKLEATSAELEKTQGELAALKRRFLGPKTEKLPPIGHEVRKKVGPDPAAAAEARRANADLRSARVVTERIDHTIPDGERKCPKCGREKLKRVGKGKPTVEWEYVPGYFRRRVHVRETLACPCGQHIVAA